MPPGGLFGPQIKLDKTQPMHVQADQLVYDSKGHRVVARGNVEITYNNYRLTADEVIYDQNANTLTAVGNAVLKDPNGSVSRADRLSVTDDFRDGFVQTISVVTKDQSRITADSAQRQGGSVTEYRNGNFTPCKTDGIMPPLWCIGAAKIIHDQGTATISYQDAHFDMFGMPILMLPYFEHADPSVKRRSGFLPPEFGYSSTLGASVEVPYYFALDPSYDFTFHPRYFSQQGMLWQGDWRQRLSNGEYIVQLAGIDQGLGAVGSRSVQDQDGFRGSIYTKGLFSLSSWWRIGWDATFESDSTFRAFYGLDSVLLVDRVNQAWIEGISDRNYFSARFYQLGGLLLNDTALAKAYAYPVIDYNYIFADPVLGGELSWKSNAVAYSSTDPSLTRQQFVNRVSSELNWRRRLTDQIGISYTPFASLRGDAFSDANYLDPISGLPQTALSGGRAQATGGLTVSYPWVANTASATHTIEPIGQIVGHQSFGDQFDLPNIDARSLIFDDTNLFEPSKFSGWDRFETGTRANYGLQYTFQLNRGGYARVLAGQSTQVSGVNPYAQPEVQYQIDPTTGAIVFQNGQPQLTTIVPQSGLQTNLSDYVLGVYLAPVEWFRVIAQSRFRESDFSLQREDLGAAFNYGPFTTQAIYTYSAATTATGTAAGTFAEEQDILGIVGVKLTDRWSLTGTARYDLENWHALTDSVELKYSDECFVAALTYLESYITDPNRDIRPDRSVMLHFEWKYLGAYNYRSSLNSVLGANTVGANTAPQ
jgi:LPS-assembly protein